MMDFLRKLKNKDYWAYGLFWSWNLIFLAFMTLGFAPRILPEMILAVGTSAIPASFLLYALILTAVPVVTILLGLTFFRRSPTRLFALGYVVEGPLMLMLAIRFFIIREVTPALNLILTVAGLGIGTYFWVLLVPPKVSHPFRVAWLRLVGLTLMVLVSLYASIWIAFYALPLVVTAVQWLGNTLADLPGFTRALGETLSDLFTDRLIWLPFTLLGFALFLYTATLFVLTPISVPLLSLQAWWRTLTGMGSSQGWVRPVLLVILTLFICTTVFIQVNQQPQHRAFTLLDSPPASIHAAQDLLDQQEVIRAGLLNAYLAPFRYISAVGEVVHVKAIYRDVFNLSEVQAARVQQLYESVARPLLYDPVHLPQYPFRRDNVALRREPQEAAALYQRFFDRTIVEGERQAIVSAVRATWSFEQAEAAWQAVDDREIFLIRQEVHVAEHADWAEVELLEVYQNQTSEPQEVIYYFNLPESAVVTGVWLGNSPERGLRFPYQVAPRGAAQAVYRNETRRMRDPALLEQIGPRQYRLRIFPVPPMQMTWDDRAAHTIVEEASPFYMWLTYQVLADGDAWPMPRLAFKRNVYWTDNTERFINGVPADVYEEAWLPEQVLAIEPPSPGAHRIDLPGGESVLAVPVSLVQLPVLPLDLRFAVVLDRSRSMAQYADQVSSSLAELTGSAGINATIDVYLTASTYRGEEPSRIALVDLQTDDILYYGGQNAAELLAQFEDLGEGRAYDAVLVFTDGTGYELGESEVDLTVPSAPVWMIHLGDDIPLGYDDDTLEIIQASGGGVVGELDQALTRLVIGLKGENEYLPRDVVDGYVWSVLPTAQAEALIQYGISEDGFTPFATRRLILAEMQRHRGSLDQLDTLDRLHALAETHHIVSPYSSMIVLVTQEQQVLLDRLSQVDDRFEREFEDLTNTTPSTPLPLAGVPEPHEWLLIGLAIAMLLWYASRRRLVWLNRRVG